MSTITMVERFAEDRFVCLPGAVPTGRIAALGGLYEAATREARGVGEGGAGDVSAGANLIVVPERDDPSLICRTEFLCGASSAIAAFVAETIAPLVAGAVGAPVCLFKDKCNEKNPGGGAFPPHQDMAAYHHFPPRNFFTAMVPLDASTTDNGCLSVATNLQDWVRRRPDAVVDWIGPGPLLRYRQGGPHNGAVDEAAAAGLDWRAVEMQPGDVLVFDAFIPHASAVNGSDRSRRALFLTFNAEREGRHYDRYYALKRADAKNPMFHVATPTEHDS